MTSSEKPLVYLILGAAGSGRRAVVADLIIDGLPEEERAFVIRRLQSDDQYSAGGEKLRLKYIWQSLRDWKTWVASMTL